MPRTVTPKELRALDNKAHLWDQFEEAFERKPELVIEALQKILNGEMIWDKFRHDLWLEMFGNF